MYACKQENKSGHKWVQWKQYLANVIWQQFEWKQAFRPTSLAVSIWNSALFSDPVRSPRSYYRGLPIKTVPQCHRQQGKQSHMPHRRVTPHLLNLSTERRRGHTYALRHTRSLTRGISLKCQWPGKWNWGVGVWYESVFGFEKLKVKLPDLDLWKRGREERRDGWEEKWEGG